MTLYCVDKQQFKFKKMKNTKYLVTNIEYDFDEEDGSSSVPTELIISVPEVLKTSEEIQDFISDEISNITGFCHFGFVSNIEKK